ncbi:MAG TPA: YIP1 family protein [bacterium]|nr:YIP1 family protein [bacterium]
MNNASQPDQRQPDSVTIWQNLFNVLSSPREVFEGIRQKVTWQDWVIPFVVIVLVSGVAGILNAPYTLEMSKNITRAQEDRILSRDMPQEQREQISQRMEEQLEKQEQRYSPPGVYFWSFGGVTVRLALSLLILAGLYYFAGNTILGGEAAFPQLLAVVALPQMVTVIQSVYNTVIMHLTGNAEVPSSLAVVLPYGAADVFRQERYQQALFTILSQIDLFTVWRLVLVTIGFGAIYQVSKGKATGVIFGYWILWLLITATGAFLFAGMGM